MFAARRQTTHLLGLSRGRGNIYGSKYKFAQKAFLSQINSSKSRGEGKISLTSKLIASLNFPDLIEHWNRDLFYKSGAVMTVGAMGLHAAFGVCQETLIVDAIVGGYWVKGHMDMNQKSHTILRNFPVLGNFRYLMEVIRPEIRQYFIESDQDGKPYDRDHRAIVYQRAKDVMDTIPFGTRKNVYEPGYEWANHSMYPTTLDYERDGFVDIGATNPECTQPYRASLLNVSAMSYGALSDNAILALSTGASMGSFYHNTGEGGVSKFHKDGGADLVWNVGTGYFGCRDLEGNFNEEKFVETASNPQVKMIEIKLSQGAKPGHGGLLPGPKVSKLIAEARGVQEGVDCHSPATHSAFSNPVEMCHFIKKLRTLSGGKPVGFKLCIGKPEEFAAIIAAMIETGIYSDFITVDGSEGGTGAAPYEFTNYIGTPLVEGLTFVNNILVGAGIRDKIKIICSGRVTSGFTVVRNIALGADLCNSARTMLFALGCVQALKCNTNRCPTGITTQDKELQKGLDVESKAVRVYNYHKDTVEAALEMMGAIGVESPGDLKPWHINKRINQEKFMGFDELYPVPEHSSLVNGTAPRALQQCYDRGVMAAKGKRSSAAAN